MWTTWREITSAADDFLDTLTPEVMQTYLLWNGEPRPENIGTMLLRNIFHYWYHIGKAHAMRQMLGHTDLPQFVGSFGEAVYPSRSPSR